MGKRVRIAISIGDPAGIGPEVTVKALGLLSATIAASGSDRATCFDVFAPRPLLAATEEQLGIELAGRHVRCVEIPVESWDPHRGALQQSALQRGRLQIASLRAALEAVCAGQADALCTAPITKQCAREAGFAHPGHTEYLAARCAAGLHAMMLAGVSEADRSAAGDLGRWSPEPRGTARARPLRVVPLTGHVPLADVPGALAQTEIAETIALTVRALAADFGLRRAAVAVVGLNPHAGEGGMLGSEEQTQLEPAIERAARGLREDSLDAVIDGPLPADGLFPRAARYDAVVCCYHDQALIPFKMQHQRDGVNVTLGLDIVRTSPAHGSALDIAGQGCADPSSMAAALQLAAAIARRRRQQRHLSS